MNQEFRLDGLDELERTLGQLPSAVAKRTTVRVLKEGGEPIAQTARELAPERLGDLKESIDVSTRLASSQRREFARESDVEVYVGPGQHPQAITQEFGTFKEPAQPFMRPAWESKKLYALDIIGTLLGISILKAAKRNSRLPRGR